MNTLPQKPLLKQKEILSADCGISKPALLKAAQAVPEMRVVPRGSSYGWFRRAVVVRVFGLE